MSHLAKNSITIVFYSFRRSPRCKVVFSGIPGLWDSERSDDLLRSQILRWLFHLRSYPWIWWHRICQNTLKLPAHLSRMECCQRRSKSSPYFQRVTSISSTFTPRIGSVGSSTLTPFTLARPPRSFDHSADDRLATAPFACPCSWRTGWNLFRYRSGVLWSHHIFRRFPWFDLLWHRREYWLKTIHSHRHLSHPVDCSVSKTHLETFEPRLEIHRGWHDSYGTTTVGPLWSQTGHKHCFEAF